MDWSVMEMIEILMTERNVSCGWMDKRKLVMLMTAFLRESIRVRVFFFDSTRRRSEPYAVVSIA